MIQGTAEAVLASPLAEPYRGKVGLVFTSPPFPLNNKKRYGNEQGEAYLEWLASIAPLLAEMLTPDGSIVVELGNAWEPGRPVMSTLALRALLAFQERAKLHLCQQFVAYNPARLPTPAQWVTVERIRVKDAFTNIWWFSPTERPKADNKRVLAPYSASMRRLLKRGTYNAGTRPSEHLIGRTSFLTDHGGAIPPNVLNLPPSEEEAAANVLPFANTGAQDRYQVYCRERGYTPHPARMPISIAQFFVRFLTDEGNLVLDPFGGSNTTGSAAEGLGRRWLAIEPQIDYIRGSRGRFDDVVNVLSSIQ